MITRQFIAPLLALFGFLLLSSCAGHIEFDSLQVPSTSLAKHNIQTTHRLTIGSLKNVPQSFQKIARTGEDHNCRGDCRLFIGSLTNNSSRFIVDYDFETFEYYVNETSPLVDKRRVRWEKTIFDYLNDTAYLTCLFSLRITQTMPCALTVSWQFCSAANYFQWLKYANV